jgi:hypothetical protein
MSISAERKRIATLIHDITGINPTFSVRQSVEVATIELESGNVNGKPLTLEVLKRLADALNVQDTQITLTPGGATYEDDYGSRSWITVTINEL